MADPRPRDYLATFLKIGVIVVGLALGIVILNGTENAGVDAVRRRYRPALWKGALFPFLFIHHRLWLPSLASTRSSLRYHAKLLACETDARLSAGAMLMESFVAVMALVAASIIEPGLYFAMNTLRRQVWALPCQTCCRWAARTRR